MNVPPSAYQILAAAVFAIGILGILLRRNLIVVLLSIEIMMNAANLSLIAFAREWGNTDGHLAVILSITIAAAEAGVGLALLVAIFRRNGSTDATEMNELRG